MANTQYLIIEHCSIRVTDPQVQPKSTFKKGGIT